MKNNLLIVFFLLNCVFPNSVFGGVFAVGRDGTVRDTSSNIISVDGSGNNQERCKELFSRSKKSKTVERLVFGEKKKIVGTFKNGVFDPISNSLTAEYLHCKSEPIEQERLNESSKEYFEELAFETKDEALGVAYEMMAQKMRDNPDIEYSIGILKKNDKYYLQTMVKGNKTTVAQVGFSGEYETVVIIHNHPKGSNSDILQPSMMDFGNEVAKDCGESIILGWVGDNISTEVLKFNPNNGEYQKLQYKNGKFKVREAGFLSELCNEKEKAYWDNNYKDKKTLKNSHYAACPSEGQIKSDQSKQVSQSNGLKATNYSTVASNGSKTTNYSTVASNNINFDVQGMLDLLEPYKEHRYHVSVEFIKEVKMGQVVNYKVYQCKECGRRIEIRPPETIEEYVAREKESKDKWDGAVNKAEDNIVEAGKKMY